MNKVFLAGESIDLCVPDNIDFEQWANWFNSQKITEYLEQGKYPNTVNQQREFYNNAVAEGRFLCMIKTKDSELLGVISLSDINYEKSSCQIALVCPIKSKKAPYASLEAMAICTQHAFQQFGLERVWAGQAYPGLKSWSQRLELIGYNAEGVFSNSARYGTNFSHAIRIVNTKEMYIHLTNRRKGKLWPGGEIIKKMLTELKLHTPLAEQVHLAITTLQQEHDRLLDAIEINAYK